MAVSTRSDLSIQEDVLEELKWDTRVLANEIGVAVKDGIVTLTGWVDTYLNMVSGLLNALRWDAAIPAGQLDVTVSKGWVTLKGEVEYNFQRRDAERAVERLSGVKGVSNLITIKPHLSPSDLKQKIEKALVRNAETDASHITIEVQGSKVILRGTVRAYAEKKAAEDTAWSAPGVSEVDNRITVSVPL